MIKFKSCILTIVVIAILYTGCKNKENKEGIQFQYSAYSFHFNEEKEIMEFYLAYYFKISEDGNYKIFKHSTFMDIPKYFKGKFEIDDKENIDSLIININNSQPIIIPDTPLLVYDGFTYCLDYKIGNKATGKIQYINSRSRCPENIYTLTAKLDALILNTRKNETDSFSLGAYIDTLKKISSFYNFPHPLKAPPIKKTQPKFIPDKE